MSVGKIVATVIANSQPFAAGMAKAGRTAKSFGKTVGGVLKRVGELSLALAAAGAATISALVVKGLKAVDAQAKLARSVEGTQRGMAGLIRASKDAGVAQEDVGKAAQMLNRRLGEAVDREGAARNALDKLGLSAKDLLALDVDERFAAISDAMREGGMSAGRMAATMGDMGIRTREMVLIMQEGGDAIRAATKEMDGYGVAVDEVDAIMIEQLNDALDRGQDALTGISNTMAVEVAPILLEIVKQFADASSETKGFKDEVGSAMDAVVTGAGWVADSVHGIQIAFRAVQLFGQVAFAGIMSAGVTVTEFLEGMVDGTTRKIVGALNVLRRLKGQDEIDLDLSADSEFLAHLRMLEETATSTALETQKALEALQDAPWPSEQLKAWVEEARAKARAAADAVAAERKRQANMVDTIATDEEKREAERRARELEARRRSAEQKLADLQAFTRTELEAENFAHAERMAAFRIATEQLGLTTMERAALIEDLERKHEEKLRAIRSKGSSDLEKINEASWDKQLVALTGAGADMVAGMGQIGEGMAKASQIAGATQAFIATLVGSAEALKLGFPAGLIAAATIAAKGFALVGAIKAASVSRGGGTTGAGAAAASVAAAPAAGAAGGASGGPPGGELRVTGLTGSSLFTGSMVQELAEEFLEYQRQGGRLVFAD